MEHEELEKITTETLRIAKQNNKMLKKIHRMLVINRTVRIIYWVFIIGSALGIYFFLQPYLEGFQQYIDTAKEFFKDPKNYVNTIIN